jgi:hypothetical protein
MDHELQLTAPELGRILSAPDGTLNPIELAVKNALREKYPEPGELEAIRERAALDETVEMARNTASVVAESAGVKVVLPSVIIGVNVRRRL